MDENQYILDLYALSLLENANESCILSEEEKKINMTIIDRRKTALLEKCKLALTKAQHGATSGT